MSRTRLFLDESGDCKCSPSSIYRHFAIAVLFVPDSDVKVLKTRFKRCISSLVCRGWDKAREVKAADVYSSQGFGREAVLDSVRRLSACPGIGVGYVVVRKEGLVSTSLRNAPYGIMYNYFAGVLLSGLVQAVGIHDIRLVYDLRNKESHNAKHFADYLHTEILGQAFEAGTNISVEIEGMESHMNRGLGAADFFSWSVFRQFESKDGQFMNEFRKKVAFKQEWYV